MRPADEHPLTGGNVSDFVVRVGHTVRRPAIGSTPAVAAFLQHLEHAGFLHAPRWLGIDDIGRQTLSWVPGAISSVPGATQHDFGPMDARGLHQVGGIVRELHDASATFRPPKGARWDVAIPPDRCDLVVHHDLAPWNLVVDGAELTFIDWDNCGPGSRLWDLAYAAHGFALSDAIADPSAAADRLTVLVDAYRLDRPGRRDLVPLLARRTRSMLDLLVSGHRTGAQPWARLYAEGHADHWGPISDFLAKNEVVWAHALGV